MKITHKLNSHGVVHHLALIVVVVAVAIGGAAYLVASHAQTPTQGTQSTYTINPGTWQTLSHASVTTDPLHSGVGNVLKLGAYTKDTAGGSANTSASGQVLASLDDFIKEYPWGHKMQICINARSISGTSDLELDAYFLKVVISETSDHFYLGDLYFNTSYSTQCAILPTATGNWGDGFLNGGAFTDKVAVHNDYAHNSGFYVNYVKLVWQ